MAAAIKRRYGEDDPVDPHAWVDVGRVSRATILVDADLFRASLVLSLRWPQVVWHAYPVAADLAAGDAFLSPTVQAIVPVLTPPDQRLASKSVSWPTGQLV